MTDHKVDSISSDKRKNPYEAWIPYDWLSPFGQGNPPNPNDTLDTIETISGNSKSTQPLAVVTEREDGNVVIQLGKKIWDWLCAPIALKRDNVAKPGKPVGDSIQPIGSAPALTTPEILIDKEMLEKLMKELKDQFHRISETLHETDEHVKQDERRLLHSYYLQMKIQEEGVDSIKHLLIFDQQQSRKIRREHYTFDGEIIELANKQRWWGNAQTALNVISTAVLVAIVVKSVLITGGLAAGITGSFAATQPVLMTLSGCTKAINVKLDFDFNQKQAVNVTIKQKVVHINFGIKDKQNHLKAGIEHISNSVELRKQVTKDLDSTMRSLIRLK